MHNELSLTQPSKELSSALAETISSVQILCPVCGNACQVKAFGAHSGQDLACVCVVCRPKLLDQPLLPEGYTLEKELGRGGMGAVYLTKFKDEARAVKLLLPSVATSKERRDLFLQEASIQQKLRHPAIVTLYELHQVSPGAFCIVMEYVPGTNASELIERKPLDWRAARAVILQALSGLSYIHQSGFLHRDLKDPNLLVSGDATNYQTKISDFGLAVPYALLGKNIEQEHTHNPSGTLPYMAPETFQRHQPSPLIDIFAIGATLYRLLSGEYPHDFNTPKSKLAVVALDPIVPLSARTPNLPQALIDVTHKALAKNPAERFQSAQEMHDALEAI